MKNHPILTEDQLAALKTHYDLVNQQHYNGELPDMPFAWGSPKGAMAAVLFSTYGPKSNRQLLPDSLSMVFTNRYKLTMEQLIPLLLHEMIHVYIITVLGDVKENHGLVFKRELARLRVKTGIDIPITETTRDLEIQGDIDPVGALIRYLTDGRHAYALFSPKAIQSRKEEFEGKWRDRYELRIVTSEYWHRKSLSYPLQRIINYKTRFWIMDAEGFRDLLDNSQIV